MRNALKTAFPEARQNGCYFHFVKCLYDRVGKLGLKKKENKEKFRLVVSYLQLLAHCPEDKRNILFEDIKNLFKDENFKYKQLFNYFKTSRLKNPFLDELYKALGTSEDVQFIIINNACEIFHLFLINFCF